MGASGTHLQLHLRNLDLVVHLLDGRSLSDTGGVNEVKEFVVGGETTVEKLVSTTS